MKNSTRKKVDWVVVLLIAAGILLWFSLLMFLGHTISKERFLARVVGRGHIGRIGVPIQHIPVCYLPVIVNGEQKTLMTEEGCCDMVNPGQMLLVEETVTPMRRFDRILEMK